MRLRECREAAGLTMREVAATIGVAKSHYLFVERGERPLHVAKAALLKECFGWEPHDLETTIGREASGRRKNGNCENVAAQPHLSDQGWVLYMMALVSYSGELPKDWRNVRRHSDLARSAMYAAVGQMNAKGRMLHA